VPRRDLCLERSGPRLKISDLAGHHPQHLPCQSGHALVGVVPNDRHQLGCFVQALRRDETELSQMPTQSVDEHCPLANQQIPGAVHHQRRLLLGRLHRHKAHRWAS
jgi:hypothetical protein